MTNTFDYHLVKTLTEELKSLEEKGKLWKHNLPIEGEKELTTKSASLIRLLSKQINFPLDLSPLTERIHPEIIQKLISGAEYLVESLKNTYNTSRKTAKRTTKRPGFIWRELRV